MNLPGSRVSGVKVGGFNGLGVIGGRAWVCRPWRWSRLWGVAEGYSLANLSRSQSLLSVVQVLYRRRQNLISMTRVR